MLDFQNLKIAINTTKSNTINPTPRKADKEVPMSPAQFERFPDCSRLNAGKSACYLARKGRRQRPPSVNSRPAPRLVGDRCPFHRGGYNPMSRTEAEFCRQQAERMHALAKQCIDPKIRDQVELMAKNWVDRGNEKKTLAA
jgi:hypothetical protein